MNEETFNHHGSFESNRFQFRYATAWELIVTAIGLLFASIASLGIPWNVITYGEFTMMLVDRSLVDTNNQTSTRLWLLEWFGGGRIL